MSKTDLTKESILSAYDIKIRDKFLHNENSNGFFIMSSPFVARTLENPYAVLIYEFILNRIASVKSQGYDQDGFVYVKQKAIQKNLYFSDGVISKTRNKLVTCGLLLEKRVVTNAGQIIYYKSNTELHNLLKVEDNLAWIYCEENKISQTKEVMDELCPLKLCVRNAFQTGKVPDNLLVATTSRYVGPKFTICGSEVHHVKL